MIIIDSNINYAQIVEFPLYRFIEQHIAHKCMYFSCIDAWFYLRTFYAHKRRRSVNCILRNLNLHETSPVRLSSHVVTFQRARTCTDANERLPGSCTHKWNHFQWIRNGRSIFLHSIQGAPFERVHPFPILLAWAREAVVREESRCGSPVMCFGCPVLFLPSSSPSPLSILNLLAEWNRQIITGGRWRPKRKEEYQPAAGQPRSRNSR